MTQPLSEMQFSYMYIGSHGKSVSWRAIKGCLTPRLIELRDATLPYEAILNTTCRDQRLILSLDPEFSYDESVKKHALSDNLLVLQITKGKALELEKFIDQIASLQQAEKHRTQLKAAGKAHEFRTLSCPHCEATLDLSLLSKTSFTYCRYCETIFQPESGLMTVGTHYRECDECGWFDRVQGYTEFYFYFLLIVYGFSYKRRFLCDSCVDRTFWKVLLTNLIFIIGIFPALWMKIKSYLGRNQALQNLAKANALAKKGNYKEADVAYSQLQDEMLIHPGVLLNKAKGHLIGKDAVGAWKTLEQSLESCSNYSSTIRLMHRLKEATEAK